MAVKKILVPTDGSTFTKNAVESAIATSKLTGASITAVYVVDASTMATTRGDMFESVTEILNQEGQEAVDAVKAQCDAAGVPCETLVVGGRPAHRRDVRGLRPHRDVHPR